MQTPVSFTLEFLKPWLELSFRNKFDKFVFETKVSETLVWIFGVRGLDSKKS